MDWFDASEDLIEDTGITAKELLFESMLEEYKEYEGIEKIMYKSFLLTVCMTLEEELKKLCTFIQFQNNQILSVFDLHNPGISKCLTYIGKVSGESVLNNNKYIDVMVKLRNAIIHEGGYIKPASQKMLLDSAKAISLGIEIVNDKVSLDKETLSIFIKGFENAMVDIRYIYSNPINPNHYSRMT